MKKAAAWTAFVVTMAAGLALLPRAQEAPAAGSQEGVQPAEGGRASGVGQTYGLGGWVEAPEPTRKVVLVWADQGTTLGHTAVSHAIAVVERLGYESGLWDTIIQTTSQFITLGAPVPPGTAVPTPRGEIAPPPVPSAARPAADSAAAGGGGRGFNLSRVDAIFAMGGRPAALTDQQKLDLLEFVREGGGFVGAHGALIQFSESWTDYKEMLSGFHDGHPFNGSQSPGYLINEDPTNQIVRHIPREWMLYDEYYMIRDFDRSKIRVLLRHDVSKAPEIHAFRRPDNDYPVAWVRHYGSGRVFYSTIGHGVEQWDNINVQRMYLEALKWATRQSDVDATPRPMPGVQRPPSTPAVPRGGQQPEAPPCAADQIVTVSNQPFCFEGPLPRGANHGSGRGGAATPTPAPASGGRGN